MTPDEYEAFKAYARRAQHRIGDGLRAPADDSPPPLATAVLQAVGLTVVLSAVLVAFVILLTLGWRAL